METREFGERLRELRERAGLSQGELAGKVGVNFTYLSKIERGVKPPPSEQVILRLAEVLDADRDELMTLAGKVPSDIAQMLKSQETLQLLRSGRTQKKMRSTNKPKSFNIRLRELRKQAGLSQRELANRIGINFTYLSKLENGVLPPPSEQVILRLAEVLNADKDELLTLAGKIPSDIVQILKKREALQLLRSSRTQKKMRLSNKIGGISMMKNLVSYKSLSRAAIPILLVFAVAASLWFASPVPVKALNIEITNPSSGTLGDTYSFQVKVNIESGDLLPVSSIDLFIMDGTDPNTAAYKVTCEDLPIPSGAGVTDSSFYNNSQTGGGTVAVTVNTASWWGYGIGSRTGYGYMYPTTGWGGSGGYHDFGAGGGWGYGYGGYQGPTSITYDITWTSPDTWPEGTYYIMAKVIPNGGGEFFTETTSFTLESGRLPGGIAITRPPEPGATDVSDVVTSEGVFTQDVTAVSDDGNVEVDIDEGTTGLTEEGEPISEITVTEMEDPPAAPADASIIGLTYDLGPDGATFDPPITLTFTYDPDEIPEDVNAEDLVIAIWDEDAGEWVELEGGVVDPVTHTITVPVSHFTAFAIIGAVPPEVPVEEITELEESIEELENQVASLEDEAAAAQTELESAQARLASAQSDYDTAKSDVTTTQAQATSLQADHDTAKSDVDAAQARVTSAQSDLANAQERLAEAQEQLAELEAERGIAWWVWLIVGLAAVAVGVTSWLVVRRRTA